VRDGFAIALRYEHEVDGLVEHGVGLNLDECAVPNERGVERRERVLLECGDLPQMALGPPGSRPKGAGEAVDAHRAAEPRERGEIGGKLPVHEDDPVPPRLPEGEPLEICRRDHAGGAALG
jgi:hypothetical protein